MKIKKSLFALSSALLLIASFPNYNQPWCAWIALVPWLLLLPGLSSRGAFLWSFFIGFVFFLGSIGWLVYVTTFGWILLCAYLALFFGAFGSFARVILLRDSRCKTQASGPKTQDLGLESWVLSLIGIPAAWVALEHARTHWLSGFGWNLLGYSQAEWPFMIQYARLTGVWGVSFILVMANVAIFQAVRKRSLRLLLIPVGLGVAATLYGLPTAALAPNYSKRFSVAVVQGSIPQDRKWDKNYQEEILLRYEDLTRKAAKAKPGLIVWPETSAPGYVGVDEELTQRLFRLAKEVKLPLLIGSPVPKLNGGSFDFFNRASLLDEDAVVATYDKLHLVPYGEFIPGDRQFPWLRRMLPPIGDFAPGKEYTVFEVSDPATQNRLKFSVLICFEDVFPELARALVRRGAQALVVMTNDAWFGPTAAAYQHAQTSAFRAVELGVPVIRAANTGWSGCIDQSGGFHDPVKDKTGRELFVEGFSTCGIKPGSNLTLYARWGDWFAWACFLAAGALLLL